jgi:hypothetical protein
MHEINSSGTYVYRSLINNKSVQSDFNDLEFGRGTMHLIQTGSNIKGTFIMGPGYEMTMEGTVSAVNNYSFLRMTGYGIPDTATDKWVYDYFGMIDPIWPDAVAQIPTITGTVIRTVDHGGAKAGVTATFYMVLTT